MDASSREHRKHFSQLGAARAELDKLAFGLVSFVDN